MAKWCEDKGGWVWSNPVERFFRSHDEGPRKPRKATALIFSVVVGGPYLWTGLDMATGFNLAADVEDVFPRPQMGAYPEGAEECYITSNSTSHTLRGGGCTADVIEEINNVRAQHAFAELKYDLAIPYMNSYADIRFAVMSR